MSEYRISHDGIVDSLEGNEVVVRITSHAACGDCHARSVCNVLEEKEKYLRIKAVPAGFKVGDRVRVILSRSMGLRALFLGYVLPFLLLMTVLLVALAAGGSELLGGLLALGILIPYYLGLKIFRGKIEKSFTFFLQKT